MTTSFQEFLFNFQTRRDSIKNETRLECGANVRER